jgi:uncharacterized damage-inducible protein DinB
MPGTPSARDLLLALIDEAYESSAWHGPTLRGSVRGLTQAQAAWRPSRGRHNIHDLVLHAAYWKYTVRQRLTGGKRGRFPRKGSNWFDTDSNSWKEDLQLLDDEHRRLRETIAALPPGALSKRVKGTHTGAYTIRGIAAHDLYHAGQIQLLKRLQRA